MPGYVIADVTVTDPETYADYRALTPGSIAAFDGRFLVRGGEHEVIAGGWRPGRLVLLEFDSPARAAAWYDSPTYVEARAIRQRASTGHMVHLEGNGAAQGGGHYVILRGATEDSDIDLANVAAHGGRMLSSGRAPAVKEGTWPDGRMTVLEFDDRAAAAAWRESAGAGQLDGEAVLVEGA
ncbi:MAG: DUF1330 domain-containing protein [Rhodospirillales bacterium]|nr:DUF1330 domain-containing protein [Rhodospirillales bacterium]